MRVKEAIQHVWWQLVRLGFRLLYNESAWTYDTVSWLVSLGAWREWQRSGIKYLNGVGAGPALEVAHGTGNLQIDLAAAGYSACGIDLSHHMGAITREKYMSSQYFQGLYDF